MPQPSPARAVVHRGAAAHDAFVGREALCRIGEDFLHALCRRRSDARPILNFWGVGGVGKTMLVKRIIRAGDPYAPELSLAYVDLDSEALTPQVPVGTFFWILRDALHRAGVETPLFDCAYFHHWRLEHPSQTFALESSPFHDAVTKGEKGSELLAPIQSLIGAAATASVSIFKVLQVVDQVATAVRDRLRRKGIADLTDEAMDGWSKRTAIEMFPVVLAYDVREFLVDNPYGAICLALDGFDRVQSRRVQTDAQNLLQRFCAHVLIADTSAPRPAFGLIVSGRRRLEWTELYDDGNSAILWRDLTDAHHVRGLDREHAAALLAGAGIDDVEGVLAAASEGTATYLPLYLSLAMQSRRGAAATTGDIAHTPRALEERFLGQLEDGELRALQVLALSGDFDEALFQYLVDHQFIVAYGRHEFGRLVDAASSYVAFDGDSAHFHRHMTAALIKSQMSQPHLRHAAGQAVEGMLRFHAHLATFVSIPAWTASNTRHYAAALTILLSACECGFVDRDGLAAWWHRIEGPVDDAVAQSTRLPLSDRRRRWLRRSNASTAELAIATWHTAVACEEAADYQLVPELADELLALSAAADVEPKVQALMLSKVASWRQWQGRHEEALALAEGLFARLCADVDVASAVTATLTYTEALRANNRAVQTLPILERAHRELGPRADPPLRLALSQYLQYAYSELGYATRALEMAREIHAEIEQRFGDQPAQVSIAASRLGESLRATGAFADALEFLRKAQTIHERTYGPTHPFVARTLYEVALTLEQANDPVAALESLQASLDILDARVPRRNVHHLMTRVVKARLLFKVGDRAGAEQLYDEIERADEWSHLRHSTAFAVMVSDRAEIHGLGNVIGAQEGIVANLNVMAGDLGRDHPMVLFYTSLALPHMLTSGSVAEAEAMARTAWELAVARTGERSERAQRSLLDYATLVHFRGRYLSARDLWRTYIDRSDVGVGIPLDGVDPNHPQKAAIQLEACATGLLAEALYCEDAIEAAADFYGRAYHCLATIDQTGSALADWLTVMATTTAARSGRGAAALECLDGCFRAYREKPDSVDVAETLVARMYLQKAAVLAIDAKYPEASSEIEAGLTHLGDDAADRRMKSEMLYLSGRVLKRQGRLAEAEAAFRLAAEVYLSVCDENDEPHAQMLYQLSLCARERGAIGEAATIQGQVRAIYASLAAVDAQYAPRLAMQSLELAAAQFIVGEVDDAKRLLVECLADFERLELAESLRAAEAHRVLAVVLLSEGRDEAAFEHAARAVGIAERNVGASDARLAGFLRTLLRAEERTGSPGAAVTAARLEGISGWKAPAMPPLN